MMTGMVTKCPACGTLFRVTPEQLQARAGMVRCGRCTTVFDASKVLAELPPEDPAAAAAGGAGTLVLEPVEPAAVASPPIAARTAEGADDDKDYGPPPRQLTLDEDYRTDEPAAPRGSRWWAAGGVLLLLLLGLQAAYFYRTDLATKYPGLKPHLVQLCAMLRCRVLPPSIGWGSSAERPKQIAIEASDLQAHDPGRPGIIQLTVTLRNHAGYDLAYPGVDLVLTDTKEHTLARRVFLPHEYLERGKDIAAGIPASAEITVRLLLDTGSLNPAGFRLDLLPAPAP
jgi:predicted Zn finger-like uncharacterized protein